MKIVVLNPPFKGKFSRTSRSPAVTKGGTLYYPFWLAYAVGVVEQMGHDIRFFDAPATGLKIEDIFARLGEFVPDLVVVDTSTPSIHNDVQMAAKIKERYPNSFIVLVGTHPSALPEETLNLCSGINAVAVGEYDYTIRDLAKVLENKQPLEYVEGLVFRKGNVIIANKKRAKIEDLNQIPFVSQVYKNHLNIKDYFFAAANYPMVMIITGRGCPYKCSFCVYPQVFNSRQYRLRSAENVVDEFDYVAKHLPGVKEIGIEDDTFTANKIRTRQICELLIQRKIKMRWYCNARADLDFETMKMMRQAGCRLVAVGFESGNDKVLKNIHKGITVNGIKDFVARAKKAKLLVHGCFMAGNSGDTKETLQDTLRLSKELKCDSVQFYPLLVYPGTEAYDWVKKNRYLLTENYNEWNNEEGAYNCVISLSSLSSEEILEYCNRATREYYLQPRYIGRKLLQMLINPREIKRTFIAAKTFLKYLRK